MSSTTQPTTFLDLYTDLLNRVRGSTSQTTTVTIAKRYINAALHDMHIGSFERFPWAERESVLVTHAKYTTGTVAWTQGSSSITGTTTTWNTANSISQNNMRVGGKILAAGDLEPYEIQAIGGDTSATAVEIRVGDTLAAGTEYTYYEDEYDLASDFLRPLDMQRFTPQQKPIRLVGRNEFRRRYPRNIILNRPVEATIIDRSPGTVIGSANTDPIRRVRFHPPPDVAYRLPYAYITNLLATNSSGVDRVDLSADTDEPIVPIRYRLAIIHHALWNWYGDREDDVQRARQAKSNYEDIIRRIRDDTEIGQNKQKFMPRNTGTRRRAMRPWRGSSGTGRFDMGNFDYGGS